MIGWRITFWGKLSFVSILDFFISSSSQDSWVAAPPLATDIRWEGRIPAIENIFPRLRSLGQYCRVETAGQFGGQFVSKISPWSS